MSGVALATRVTDINGSPTGSWPRRGRRAPAYAFLVEYGELYLHLVDIDFFSRSTYQVHAMLWAF